MQVTIDRLLALRVSDVMTRPVVKVSEADSMAHAAAVMLTNKVSGTPVTDSTERCVGMLSAIDFMRRQHAETKQGVTVQDPNDVAAGALNKDLVQQHMSTRYRRLILIVRWLRRLRRCADLTSIDCRSSAPTAASWESFALDIVAAVMNAVEEMKS